MIQDLTWDNFIELNDFIKNNDFAEEFFSTIQLVQRNHYGFKLKFNKLEDVILMYAKYQDEPWCLFSSWYKKDFALERAKQQVKSDLSELNQNNEINIIDFSIEAINDWKLNDYQINEEKYISNYIYELKAFKTFEGKKMQKKRNHLNAFLRENYNLLVKNIFDADFHELISFTKQVNKKYNDDVRQDEIDVYEEILFNQVNKDKRFSGIVVYIDNKIVGYTLGFLNNNIYEIIIEKAERDIRGLYQFIIKTNLNQNNIDCEFVEREDDLGDPMIAKSKQSYHPIKMIKRYYIDDVKW